MAGLLFIIGLGLGYFIRRYIESKTIQLVEKRAEEILKKAEEEAEEKKRSALLEAKEEIFKLRNEAEREIRERRNELTNLERRILQREENLERKEEILANKEREINNRLESVKRLEEEAMNELQKIAQMTKEEAKEILLKHVEEEIQKDIAIKIKEAEAKYKEMAEEKAREIITEAIQRCAVDHTVESTVSVVSLPSEEMKGRIIGREGRNIRTFETLTGVDLIIDDTPEAVVLSSFDPVRREIARIALERLVKDGRIHPARIEEMVNKAKKEVENRIREEGERALIEVGIQNIHPDLVRTLGRLYYRTSYGQNVLQHSIEVAKIAAIIAAELHMDVNLAKRAGLLHDIGKAIDYEVEGSHATLGAELLKKYGEHPDIVHAVAAHHEEIPLVKPLDVIIQVADSISAVRPGARRESIEIYIKRLEKLEEIAMSFPGVEKAYAIQAGREVRVLVSPEEVDDLAATRLAYQIAKKIEKEMEYPGQIKVTVIRETRAVEYAK
ncbi:ribonuclease Y [Dictyoglomus thermophilum]|nr:ribonuclease Y [Dictyoglomus thermophilum]TYT22944.1 ribonuclease Y [Dictyoglomus thermophilum]